jgi:hypothetical protein
MPVPVIRQDSAGRNQQWMLDVGQERVTLSTPNGQPILEWDSATVSQAVQFPSFSKSIKYTGFTLPRQGTFQFSMDAATLKQLRAFANRGIAASGPQAIRSVLRNAILTVSGGLALLVGGTVLALITVRELATGNSVTNGPHPAGFITAIVGFAILCRGIYGLYHYSQLRKLSQ